MREDDSTSPVIAIERELLREITASPAMCARAERGLLPYEWRSPDHQVVFEALIRITRGRGQCSANLLCAEVTRMGFPDVEIREYFSLPAAGQTARNENESQEIVTRLIAQLKSATDRE